MLRRRRRRLRQLGRRIAEWIRRSTVGLFQRSRVPALRGCLHTCLLERLLQRWIVHILRGSLRMFIVIVVRRWLRNVPLLLYVTQSSAQTVSQHRDPLLLTVSEVIQSGFQITLRRQHLGILRQHGSNFVLHLELPDTLQFQGFLHYHDQFHHFLNIGVGHLDQLVQVAGANVTNLRLLLKNRIVAQYQTIAERICCTQSVL